MVKVEADKAKNVLFMTFSGHVVPEEMKTGEERLKVLLTELKPGFRLLTDLTPLDSMDPACLAYVRRNMDQFSKRGVSQVLRVIPDPHKDIGLNILSIFHYPRKTRIATYENMKDALAALAG
jgi:hypothetical protein